MSSRGRGRAGPAAIVAAVLVGCTLARGAPLLAQNYGRWWWDARLAYRGLANQTEVGEATIRDYDEEELRLELGLNGYLRHPALGRFRLGLEAATLDVGGDRPLESDRLGYAAELDLLPRGPAPLYLGYRRGSFDYTPGPTDPAFFLPGATETSESLSARLRLRRGPLQGTLLGAELFDADLAGEQLGDDSSDRFFARWNRRLGVTDNSVRVERQERAYGRLGYDTGLWTATFDQHARWAERWRWQLGLAALRTETRFAEREELRLDDLRWLSTLKRDVLERDLLDLRLDAARISADTSAASTSYRLAVAYRWRPRAGAEIAPFVEAGELGFGDASERIARVGLELSYSRLGRLDARAGVRGSYATTSRRAMRRAGEDDLAYSANLSLGTGRRRKMRNELELEAGRNELRFDRLDGDLDVPDGPLLATTFGTQDFARARYRISRQNARGRLGAWVERRDVRLESLDGRTLENDALTGTLDASWRGLALLANVGEIQVESAGLADRTVEFFGGNLNLRLLRGLSLYANYRHDLRRLVPLPDLEADRGEAGLTFHLGLLRITGSYYRYEEMLASDGLRIDEGYRFGVTRDLAGWLPIVTGARRRGEVK